MINDIPIINQRVNTLIHDILKIKQREFARAMGIKDCNVTHIVYGERPVGVKLMQKICTKYDVSAEWLLGLSDQPYRKSEWKTQDSTFGLVVNTAPIVCKKCGNQPLRDTKFDMLYYSDYCPFCGCYMRKEKSKWQF